MSKVLFYRCMHVFKLSRQTTVLMLHRTWTVDGVFWFAQKDIFRFSKITLNCFTKLYTYSIAYMCIYDLLYILYIIDTLRLCYYIILCYVMLCCILLCYIMLYYIILHYIMLYYIIYIRRGESFGLSDKSNPAYF